jgi:hypothetical protein
MFTEYKRYRINTEVRGKFGIFEVYQPTRNTPQPNRFEATGYVMDDFSGQSLEARAQEHARMLVDYEFNTLALDMIRNTPRY